MSLQFIMGGSGSGKTRHLYENLIARAIKEPHTKFFVIVPEQFTMQTQKEIVSLHPDHGVMNIDIVSFQRLAYRIFEELSIERLDILDDTGKNMVLRKVAAIKKKELRLFDSQLSKTGFVSQLKSMVSEFFQYGIEPKQVEHMAETAQTAMLRLKLHDLAILYQGFQDYIEKRYVTTEQLLDVLCRRLPESEIIRNSVITLDGYTGFTPVQYRLISLLMGLCREISVTITIDPMENPYEKVSAANLFHMSCHTAWKLKELAETNNISMINQPMGENRPLVRFSDSPALDFLEQNLYRYGKREYRKNQEEIQIFQAVNPLKEVAFLTTEVKHLVMEKGLRYRDIAVVTGDLPSYANEIERQFQENRIPCFLDHKRDLMGNPMIEFVRAALEVIYRNFSYESVFRYLKTGMVREDKEELSRLENYVLALGIRGYDMWDNPWKRIYYGGEQINLEQLNQLKDRVFAPLKNFRQFFESKGTSVRAICEGIVNLLMEQSVEEQLEAYQEYFTSVGEHNLSKEYQQVYGLTMDLLDQMVRLLGDEKVGRKEFCDLLDSGFSELKVGFIPATVDRVVVGDITRTRLDQIKVLFFVGVNDGIIPPSKGSTGIISDGERHFLKAHEMELAPTAKEDGFMQRFYLYLMMTKPRNRLYLTFSSMSSQGKGLRPSTLISQMKKLFPLISVKEAEIHSHNLVSPTIAKKRIIEGLRRQEEALEDTELMELLSWFGSRQDNRKKIDQLLDGAFYSYQESGIGRTAAKALYGSILNGSVTRLEGYESCAYAHFLNYGLELKERQQYEIRAVDLGNLFHNSIDLFFRQIAEEKVDYQTLSETERKGRVAACVSQVVSEYGNTIMGSSARNEFLASRVEKITDRTIWALCEQLKKGEFVPTGFELSFSAKDHLRAMRIPLSEEEALHLRGRIDRLDICEEDDRILVKIIDYKSGSTRFDLVDLYYGLQLQLVVYMDAVMELEQRKHLDKKIVPAGIFYYNISDPMVERQPNMEESGVQDGILKQLRMNGLVNSSLDVISRLDREIETESRVIPVVLKNNMVQDYRSSVAQEARFTHLSQFVHKKLTSSGQEILRGNVETAPYKRGNRSACDYCPYHSVCGFDLNIEGYHYRKFKNLKPEEIWNMVEGGEAGEVDKGTESGY